MPATSSADGPASGPVAAVSPAMRLLLAAALQPPDEAAAAWAAWLHAVDFEDLEAGSTALLSLVARNLPDLHAPPSIEGRVRGVQRQTWASNRVLWSAVEPVLVRLASVAGTPLLLPSAALVPAFDGGWGARPWYRIEVGVHPATTADVRAALAETGWPVGHLTPRLLAWTEAGLVDRWQARDAGGNWLSVRWRVLRGVASEAAAEQLRGGAVRTTLGTVPVHLLHPADALVERLWNAPDDPGPGWIVEVVAVARPVGASPADLTRFVQRARGLGLDRVLLGRLDEVAAVVGDPAVDAARAALAASGPSAVGALWNLPGPLAGVGRSWAGHAAGQGAAAGARSLLRVRRTVARVR